MGARLPYIRFYNNQTRLSWEGYIQLESNGSQSLSHNSSGTNKPTSTSIFETLKAKQGHTISITLFTDSGMSVDVANAECTIDQRDQAQVFTYTYYTPFMMQYPAAVTLPFAVSYYNTYNEETIIINEQGYIDVINSDDVMLSFEANISTAEIGQAAICITNNGNELFEIPYTGTTNTYTITASEFIYLMDSDGASNIIFETKTVLKRLYPSFKAIDIKTGFAIANHPMLFRYQTGTSPKTISGNTQSNGLWNPIIIDCLKVTQTAVLIAEASGKYLHTEQNIQIPFDKTDIEASVVVGVSEGLEWISGMLDAEAARQKFGLSLPSGYLVTPDGNTWAHKTGSTIDIGFTPNDAWWDERSPTGDLRWEKTVGDSILSEEVIAELETDYNSIPLTCPVMSGVISQMYKVDGATINRILTYDTPICQISK